MFMGVRKGMNEGQIEGELLADKKRCTVGPESQQQPSGVRLLRDRLGWQNIYIVELSLEKLVKACEGMNEG